MWLQTQKKTDTAGLSNQKCSSGSFTNKIFLFSGLLPAYMAHWTCAVLFALDSLLCDDVSSLLFSSSYVILHQVCSVSYHVFNSFSRFKDWNLKTVVSFRVWPMSVSDINISQSVLSGWQETIGPVLSDSFEVCLLTFGFNLENNN